MCITAIYPFLLPRDNMSSVLASLCLVLAICQGVIHSAEANISFSTVNATSGTYRDFITTLRTNLKTGGTKIYGIPVLREGTQEYSERFVLADLSNNAGNTATVAIDVVTLLVPAFSNGAYSYFLNDASPEARSTLFDETTPFILPFGGRFYDLEEAANQSREEIVLGLTPLDEAIATLFNTTTDDASKAASLIVVIETVIEAVKFKFIEQRHRDSIQESREFLPDPAMLSLEDNWSELSFQIASSYNGLFRTTIELRNITDGTWLVNNVRSNVVVGVALLEFQCHPPNKLRMPVDADQPEDSLCTPQATTTHISGANGLCVDVKNGNTSDGNHVQLWQCGVQRNQRWTFETNGTIHSVGKCLATNDDGSNYVIIINCTTAASSATEWELSLDGTISNPSSGLVLTAQTSADGFSVTEGTNLTVEADAGTPSQGWRVGEDVVARVTIIKGYNDQCWEVSNITKIVGLKDCVQNKREQLWALYSDGTIRLDSDHTSCVNSEGDHSGAKINLTPCAYDWSDQRWVFKTDWTILNPYADLVIDATDSLEQLVLSTKSNGNLAQQFLPYF